MWRDYSPGFAQLLVGLGLGGGVLVMLVVVGLLPNDAESPAYTPITGTQLALYNFSQDANGWRLLQFAGDNGFTMIDGALTGQVAANAGYMMTTQNREFRHVVIDAMLQAGRVPSGVTVSVGITCHNDADGNGYYFLLAEGLASIRAGTPNNPDDLMPIVDWQPARAVTDLTTPQSVRVVCAYGYLALFVNGEFVMDAEHEQFQRGYVGVTLAGDAEHHAAVTASWDTITVYEASRIAVR